MLGLGLLGAVAAPPIAAGPVSAIGQVTGLAVYSATPESLILTWDKPAGMMVTPATDGTYSTRQQGDYRVEWRLAGGAWAEWVKYPVVSHEDSLQEAIIGLTPGADYEFRVSGRTVTAYRPNTNTPPVILATDDIGPASAVLAHTMPAVPAVPAAAGFLAAAAKVQASSQAVAIVEDGAGAAPSLTALATLDAANPATLSPINGRASPRVGVAAMPGGATGRIGKGWILGNRRTGARRASQGGSLRFAFTGQVFDFTASTAGGLGFRVRYSDDGGASYRWVKDWVRLAANTGTHYIVCDFGAAASRIVEVHGEAAAIIGGFNFDTTPADATVPPAAPVPASQPRLAMWADSYVYGQGDGVDFTQCFAARVAANLGTVAMYNHGFQTNPWGGRSGAADIQAGLPERLSNPWMAQSIGGVQYPGATGEIDAFGALDVVFLCATINDNAAANDSARVARLYAMAVAAFRIARARQPNALIVFTTTMFDPGSVPAATVVDAYRSAFAYVLGADPGAIMLDAVAEGWSATVGPTANFPATGDTVHPSPAGHLHYGDKIAAGAMVLVERVIAANEAPPGEGAAGDLRATSAGDMRITSAGDTRRIA